MVFAVALWCIHQRSAKSTPQAQKLRWPVVGKVALMLPATPKWRFLSGTLMQIFVRNLKLTSKDCLKQTGDFKRFWNGAKLCFSATSRSHGNLNKKQSFGPLLRKQGSKDVAAFRRKPCWLVPHTPPSFMRVVARQFDEWCVYPTCRLLNAFQVLHALAYHQDGHATDIGGGRTEGRIAPLAR